MLDDLGTARTSGEVLGSFTLSVTVFGQAWFLTPTEALATSGVEIELIRP